MNPNLKTAYFSKNNWEASWIDTAIGLVRDLWTERYKPAPTTATTPQSVSLPVSLVIPPLCSPSASQAQLDSIASLFNTRVTSIEDPFEEYIATGTVDVSDPLAYWHALLTTPRQEPLARMALDVLSAPGTSFLVFLRMLSLLY